MNIVKINLGWGWLVVAVPIVVVVLVMVSSQIPDNRDKEDVEMEMVTVHDVTVINTYIPDLPDNIYKIKNTDFVLIKVCPHLRGARIGKSLKNGSFELCIEDLKEQGYIWTGGIICHHLVCKEIEK